MKKNAPPFQQLVVSSAEAATAAGTIVDAYEKTEIDVKPCWPVCRTDPDLIYMKFPDGAQPCRLPKLVRNKHMLSCCRQCKHLVEDPRPTIWAEQNTNSAVYELSPYCKLTRRDIQDVCSFPAWCPLHEVDVQLQLREHRF